MDRASTYTAASGHLWFPEHVMLRISIVAFAIVSLSAGFAQAQINPITSGMSDRAYNGYSFGLAPGYETPMSAERIRDAEIERKYKETMKKIPDKKPSNDPWAGVRTAPVADRHRPM